MLPKEPELKYPELVMPPTVERAAVKIRIEARPTLRMVLSHSPDCL